MADLDISMSSSDSDLSYEPSEEESSTQSSDELEFSSSEDDETVSDIWGECSNSQRPFCYTGTEGLMVDKDFSHPLQCYEQFVNEEVLELVVTETNRYAAQLIATTVPTRRSLMKKWRDTTVQEMKSFIAVLMAMGINHLPKMRLYWSYKPLYRNDFIRSVMQRDRFEVILKCLHFYNPNAGHENRLMKIKPLLDVICRQFQSTITPGEKIVVDESMVPWRGRLIFRQYLPGKAHKYGIKCYKVCTPEAYTYKMSIYSGKSDSPRNDGKGHAEVVVLELTSGLINEGRTVYVDNFYSSVSLCEELLQKKTYLCGTLRKNRKGNPKDVTSKKLKKGELLAKEKKGVRVMKWQDRRPVLMISSDPAHTDSQVKSASRTRDGNYKMKPLSTIDYNAAKKGVDVSDQMSAYYTCLRRSMKWYKKVAVELLLGTCVVNAWVLFNRYTEKNKQMAMLEFREKIIEELTNSGGEGSGVIKRKSQHKLKTHEGRARDCRKRCLSCYQKIRENCDVKEAKAKAKKVKTYCEECDGQPAMCLICFNERHT